MIYDSLVILAKFGLSSKIEINLEAVLPNLPLGLKNKQLEKEIKVLIQSS